MKTFNNFLYMTISTTILGILAYFRGPLEAEYLFNFAFGGALVGLVVFFAVREK